MEEHQQDRNQSRREISCPARNPVGLPGGGVGVSVRTLIKTRMRLTACLAEVPPEAQVLPGLLAFLFRSDTT